MAEGCSDPAYARELCSAHYQRKINGRESSRPVWRKLTPLTERLESWLAESTRAGDCIEYPFLNKSGYPTSVHDDKGKSINRYRAVYLATRGELPKWAQIHHKCANKACINPDHLALSSQRENIAEMLVRRELNARIAHLEAELASYHCAGCHCSEVKGL